ncbi:MAG: DUF1592 domain-containing protein [Planctomycetota bacterium]|nr:DUF1592 domain-containing protein [Planctomycetota bacterium]
MTQKLAFVLVLLVLLVGVTSVEAQDAFRERVLPFVKEYCVECHNETTSEGELNLTQYTSVEMLGEHFRQWEHVISFMKKEEMPPEDAKQPSPALRAGMLKTIDELLKGEARKLAGDPGPVLPRRLTNAEYNYTIRDLTGVDIQPTNSFPVDPASGEGFNNTGEALTMSPSLFKKHYAAAQQVADHVLLTPSGMKFAPYSVVTYADQEKFHERAILSFYEQHNVSYEKYLTAAWSYRNRTGTEFRTKSIGEWAIERNLSPNYLRRLHELLEGDGEDGFYVGWLRQRWSRLASQETPNGVGALAGEIRRLSQLLCRQETQAIVSNAGNPPIVHIERRSKTAGERDLFNETLISDTRPLHVELRDLDKQPFVSLVIRVGEAEGSGFVTLSELDFSTQSVGQYRPGDHERNTSLQDVLKEHAPDQLEQLKFGRHPLGKDADPASLVLASPTLLKIKLPSKAFGEEKRIHFHAKAKFDRENSTAGFVRLGVFDHEPSEEEIARSEFPLVNPDHPTAARLKKSCEEFCSTFPNRFLYVDDTRGLSAGFHLIEGFFRDDQPLCKLVLDEQQNAELNRLWDELYFGTGITEKFLRGFVFFERSERNFMKHESFDSIKEEDPKLVGDEALSRFRDLYLARFNVKTTGDELKNEPVYRFFETVRSGLKKQASTWKQAEPIYLRQLEELARRAWRRPLTDAERNQLRTFFAEVSRQPEYGVAQAVRASLIRLLVSPHFTYRMAAAPDGESVEPLSDIALASRLSYFLWSSMPDAELLSAAESGGLQNEATLRAQTKRMLKDPKVSEFALEFFGQWLGHRDFLSRESVNREVFREFDDELKQAMFDEPTRVIAHLIQSDLPVTDLLSSNSTFVNARLAKHYGVPFSQPVGDGVEKLWSRIDGLKEKGRGGLLGMAVFLTKNSQPERTSPVKRGFWVFHKVLGEHIPAPPADVAVLPKSETDTNGKTIRELLKLHTDDAKCARCHVRFDPIGLAMEGFDATGRARSTDLAGRPVDNLVQLPNGQEARGVPEFADYLATHRRDDFVRTLCRKFLGYALGRSLLLSDQLLLEKMQTNLKENDYRFSSLFETVVLSPQFQNERCRDFSAAKFRVARIPN